MPPPPAPAGAQKKEPRVKTILASPSAWAILALGFADLFVNYAVRLGYGVILPAMIGDLGLGRTGAGTIYNAYLVVYIGVAPLAGWFTDRIGARRVISGGLFVLGTGVLLLGRAQSLAAASLAFGLAGLGASGLWVPVITLVQRWFAPGRRGLALGLLSTGYGLGFAASGVLFPPLLELASWRTAWTLLGAAALLLVLPNAALLRSDPTACGRRPWGESPESPAVSPAAPGNARMPLAAVFRMPVFWRIGASYALLSFGLYGLTTFLVDFAAGRPGISLERAGLLATVHGLFQVVGVLVLLPASDRLGRRDTMLASNLAVALVLVRVAAGSPSWPELCMLTALFAACYGATFPIYGACAGDYFPREAMGTVAGLWTPFYGAGAILTHWVTGMLRDATGSYGLAFGLGAACAAAASLLMLGVPRRGVPHGPGPGDGGARR